MCQCGVGLHELANFISISHRHKHVGKHQVWMHVRDLPHCRLAIPNGNDVNALILQRKHHHLLDVAVVVRNQNFWHQTPSGDTSPGHATPNAPWPCRIPCLIVLEHSRMKASIVTEEVCVGSEYYLLAPFLGASRAKNTKGAA